jgi:hypothetical protein
MSKESRTLNFNNRSGNGKPINADPGRIQILPGRFKANLLISTLNFFLNLNKSRDPDP